MKCPKCGRELRLDVRYGYKWGVKTERGEKVEPTHEAYTCVNPDCKLYGKSIVHCIGADELHFEENA